MAEDTETTAAAPSTETSAPSAKVITEPISPIRLRRLEIDPIGGGWMATFTELKDFAGELLKGRAAIPERMVSWKSHRMERAIAWAVRWLGIRAELEHFTRTKTEEGERATIDLLMIEEKNILVQTLPGPPSYMRLSYLQATPGDIDQATAEELAKQIRAVLWNSCDAYTAANGRVYRW
jgi:hypothetical protein